MGMVPYPSLRARVTLSPSLYIHTPSTSHHLKDKRDHLKSVHIVPRCPIRESHLLNITNLIVFKMIIKISFHANDNIIIIIIIIVYLY